MTRENFVQDRILKYDFGLEFHRAKISKPKKYFKYFFGLEILAQNATFFGYFCFMGFDRASRFETDGSEKG